ncbi:MAG TPA: hypothetical protein VH186_22055 [Chloroflexia bacterium]|nr:hypothetical protein [Chloroflexia bacterium]
MSDEKRVNYVRLQELANEVSGSDLTALRTAFQNLEQSVRGLSNYYEAQRATDLINQLAKLVDKVMSDVEPVCKAFTQRATEEAEHFKKFANSAAQISGS